jgi:hypothetical protein
MRRNPRRFSACMAMLALLFAQVSLAAYACPLDSGGGPRAAAAAMPIDCPGRDAALLESALCELHCQVVASVPSSPAADLGAASAAPLMVDRYVPPSIVAPRSVHRTALATMATAPPIALRCCRLLI